MAKDYYRILGVDPRCKPWDLIDAMYVRTQKYHPLYNPGHKARMRMQEIAEAWQVLGDPKSRKEYDDWRAENLSSFRLALERAEANLRTARRLMLVLWRLMNQSRKNLALVGMAATILFMVYTPLLDGSRSLAAARVGVPPLPTPLDATASHVAASPAESPALPSGNRAVLALTKVEAYAMNPTGASSEPAASPTLQPTIESVSYQLGSRPAARYAAPVLTRPANGADYECSRDLMLEWSLGAPGTLKDGEWFVVESRQKDHADWFTIADWTRDLSVSLHPSRTVDGCDAIWWRGGGVYEWRVRIIQGDRASHTIQQSLSDPSLSMRISYQP